MRVLIACERSGRVREAFASRGHEAWSADLEPSDIPGRHVQGDVLPLLRDSWDLVIGFPPCTDLACVGARYWPEKQADGRQAAAVAFVEAIWTANAPRVAIENPMGYLNRNWRPPTHVMQPWEFGDPWFKRTYLWLRGLPPLMPVEIAAPSGHWVDGGTSVKYRDRDYGDAGLGGGIREAARKRVRSQTFVGVAEAMAEQWGTWGPR